MKIIISVLMVLSLCLSLSGCKVETTTQSNESPQKSITQTGQSASDSVISASIATTTTSTIPATATASASSTATPKTATQTPTINSQKLMVDNFDYLCENLEKNHKNLYANISKEAFLAKKKEIAESVGSMSDVEYYYALKSLVALVSDAHTSIHFDETFYHRLNFIAFSVYKFDNDWILMALDKDNEQYLGQKLIAINDTPIEDVYNKALQIISYENQVWAQILFPDAINTQEALEFLGIKGKNDPIIFTVETATGSREDITMKPYPGKKYRGLEFSICKPDSKPETAPSEIYRMMAIDEKNLFVQYNACKEDPALPMADFANMVKNELQRHKYTNFILDLRYNKGGNSAVIEPLMTVLKEYKAKLPINFYTLIGSQTFSSGIINSIQAKYQLNSILIGSPTGGNVNSYGEVLSFNLKNYPFLVMYSINYFELIKGYDKDSLYPDIQIIESFDDYISGKDIVVNWILENAK